MNIYTMNVGDEDSRDCHSPDVPLILRFSRSTSMGSIPPDNTLAIGRGNLLESSSCSVASMVDPFCPAEINVLNNVVSFNASAMEGTLDLSWNLPNLILGGDIRLPSSSSSSMLSQSLSQIPTDLDFIERGVRFSCFSGGNFGEMLNSFTIPRSVSQYSRGLPPIHENETYLIEGTKDVSIDHGHSVGSLNSGRKTKIFIRSHDEANQGQCESGNEFVDAEFSTIGNQAEPFQLEGTGQVFLAKEHDSNKRRKIVQDTELDEIKRAADPVEPTKHNSEIQIKGDQNTASTTNKPSGKHGKLVPQASGSPKQEYIHVRARRGQATNSHSLAERVRREKISERMKYLQDLVPGCSKATGKAVMLDEIINYVQSLQQQVEFLSMKLASVNPQLDYDFGGTTANNILQSQAGPSSGLGFYSGMSVQYPLLNVSQPGTIQTGLIDMGTSSNALKRNIISHITAMSGGNKDSTSEVPDV